MDALIVASIAVLPTFGFACWLYWATLRTEDEMRSFVGYEGMHLEP